MKTAIRLSVLALLLVLAALLLWWWQYSNRLHVLEWSYYNDDKYWQDFKSNYGAIKPKYGDSDADLYGQLKLGLTADVVHVYTSFLKIYVDEGLVEEIDVTKLTNWDEIPEFLKAMGRFNGKQYFIPWDWGFSSILYRTDKVEGTIDSWAALLDPRYGGHISMYNDGPSAVEVSSFIHNYDETNLTTEQLEAIKDEWIKQRELNLFYWNDEPELTSRMAGEHPDVWVAYAWPSAYTTLKKESGVPVAYADPKERRAGWVGFYGVLKGTKRYELALKFIDEKLSTKTAGTLLEDSYGVANQEVMNSISDPILKQTLDLSVLQRANIPPEITSKQRDAWTEMWTKVH